MRLLRRVSVTVCAVALLLVFASSLAAGRSRVALAHPLGNFTVNQYSRIDLAADRVFLRYVVDMAEVPTFQEMRTIDRDRDAKASEAEQAAYLPEKAEELRRGLHLYLNGSVLHTKTVDSAMESPLGDGGLPTLRISLLLEAPFAGLQRGLQEQVLAYRNENNAQKLGWQEIVVRAGEGVSLLQSTAPQQDQSDELRTYPRDMLASPPTQREASVVFRALASGSSFGASATVPIAPRTASSSERLLSSLMASPDLNLPLAVLAVATAALLGAAHAASPGHGKAIMAAYLLGTRGTALHALSLGLVITVSHTLGVLGLGLVVLYASRMVSPDLLYPWLGLGSGLTVSAIGLWLLLGCLRRRHEISHRHPGQDLPHTHSGSFPVAHHASGSPANDRLQLTWRNLAALGLAGGLVPSASALLILLASISLHRIGFGLVLVLAFSAGMAIVLTGVGLTLVYAHRAMEELCFDHLLVRRARAALPLATALVVVTSGLVLIIRASIQLDVI